MYPLYDIWYILGMFVQIMHFVYARGAVMGRTSESSTYRIRKFIQPLWRPRDSARPNLGGSAGVSARRRGIRENRRRGTHGVSSLFPIRLPYGFRGHLGAHFPPRYPRPTAGAVNLASRWRPAPFSSVAPIQCAMCDILFRE